MAVRRVVIECDEQELEYAAESSKCSVERFIAAAVGEALALEQDPEQEYAVHLVVDGVGVTVWAAPEVKAA